MNPNKIRNLLLLLSLFLFLGACSEGIKNVVEPPRVQVHKVELGDFNLSGGNAVFVLDIQNPNRFSIPLSGFDYGLSLNGVSVAKGNKEQRVTIRAGESEKVEVPLRLSFTNMITMLPGIIRDRELNYSLDGSVHLPWFNIPFQRAGRTTLR